MNYPSNPIQIWWMYKTNKFIGTATTVRQVNKKYIFKGAEFIKKKTLLIPKGRRANIYHSPQLNSVGNDQTIKSIL